MKVARLLIEAGASISKPSESYDNRCPFVPESPLAATAMVGDLAIILELLEAGADPDDDEALSVAAHHGAGVDIFSALFEAAKRVGVSRTHGTTAMIQSILKNDDAVTEKLLGSGVSVNSIVWAPRSNNALVDVGLNALGAAILSSPSHAVDRVATNLRLDSTLCYTRAYRRQTQRGAGDPEEQRCDRTCYCGGDCLTPLELAGDDHNVSVMNLLLETSAQVGKLNVDRAITRAARSGSLEALLLLLDFRGTPEGLSLDMALVRATEHGYPHVVRFLLGRGADGRAVARFIPDDFNSRHWQVQRSAFQTAIIHCGRVDTHRILLESTTHPRMSQMTEESDSQSFPGARRSEVKAARTIRSDVQTLAPKTTAPLRQATDETHAEVITGADSLLHTGHDTIPQDQLHGDVTEELHATRLVQSMDMSDTVILPGPPGNTAEHMDWVPNDDLIFQDNGMVLETFDHQTGYHHPGLFSQQLSLTGPHNLAVWSNFSTTHQSGMTQSAEQVFELPFITKTSLPTTLEHLIAPRRPLSRHKLVLLAAATFQTLTLPTLSRERVSTLCHKSFQAATPPLTRFQLCMARLH